MSTLAVSRRSGQLVVSLTLTAILFVVVLPLVSQAPWSAIASVLTSLTAVEILGLTALWFAGLYAHSFVLTAAMPTLTHCRALTLNLTGSAVSNVVPLGGALGIGLNYRMSRTWGFSPSTLAVYTFVTNLWDVLTKLSLPALALAALLATGGVTRPQLATAAEVALGALVLLVGAVGAALGSEVTATKLGRGLERATTRLLWLTSSPRRPTFVPAVLQLRRESLALLRHGWAQLSVGMIAYCVLQVTLLWTCLHLLGSTLSTPQVFAGYALERVLTLFVITPGGAGLVEVGITALLVAFGGTPVSTVAGVLLYRAFTFGLEIPVGAAGLAVWLWLHRGGRDGSGLAAAEPQQVGAP